ncbi:MAG TPA: hypothetical protein VL727_10150 [Puia sp.]|jgi:DNA-3-methyladenine glycosylase II|nr:hypothetical protein [Puia sp.]
MDYLLHLAKDKKLKKLIGGAEPLSVRRSKDILFYLIASIMSQQLSTKVADTIKNRFLGLYDGRIPLPDEVLATAPETLRSIGLSNAKVSYVQNVARFALEHGLDDEVLHKMDNEAVIEYLTQIKGVGRWTVEMLLMFGLGREDIFAIDDWGVQNAMIHIYKLDRTDKKAFREALLRISQKWSPYRTYACMHLWRWKDNSPVVSPAAKTASAQAKKPATPASKTPATKSAGTTKAASATAKKSRPKAIPAKKASPHKSR